MNSKLLFFWLLILITSTLLTNCRNNDQTKAKNIDAIKKNIIGLWGGKNEDSPIWNIGTDSIYYFEHKKSYKYNLFGDSLVIIFPDYSYALKNINLVKDTLSFKSDIGGRNFIYKFRWKTKPDSLISPLK